LPIGTFNAKTRRTDSLGTFPGLGINVFEDAVINLRRLHKAALKDDLIFIVNVLSIFFEPLEANTPKASFTPTAHAVKFGGAIENFSDVVINDAVIFFDNIAYDFLGHIADHIGRNIENKFTKDYMTHTPIKGEGQTFVEFIFAINKKQRGVVGLITKQAGMIMRTLNNFAIFSAIIIAEGDFNIFLETLNELNQVRAHKGVLVGEVLIIIGERDKAIVFMTRSFMDHADSPLAKPL